MAESSGSASKDSAEVLETKDDGNPTKTEDDLDSLLDSALDDFSKVPKEKPAQKKAEEEPASKDEAEAEAMWADMIKQALQGDPNIRDMFQQGSGEENSFVQDFSKIAEAAAKVIEGDTPNNLADIMSETLRNLNQNSESIQNQFGNPEELANLFQELGLNGPAPGPDGATPDEIPPFLQTIMQSFLSKEILYPSMKEFVEKYPVWLEEHKDSLSEEQYNNYCKQLEIMKKIIEEFEAEAESDSEDVKRQRFQRIMGYMQQMQALGQPPAELVGGDVPLDESMMPNFPPGVDPSQCSLM